MQGEASKIHTSNSMCPSERRKVRANVLKARRVSPLITVETKICPTRNSSITHKISPLETSTPVDGTEDKRVARKLRNRASALASRNKRTEEIEMLTYRLELMTKEAKRLQTRLSRYEDSENCGIVTETNFQIRRKRDHCFITEPAVF